MLEKIGIKKTKITSVKIVHVYTLYYIIYLIIKRVLYFNFYELL